jgi:putative oxidoreductase
MKQILDLYSRGVESIQKLDWLPVLFARSSMGSIFILSGWGKLNNLPKVTEFFTELGIPFPGFNAGLVGLTEFGCGLLILLGLFTRLASIPLIATMTVAIMTAKRSDITTFTDVLGFEEFVYITIFVWLLVGGAGRVALDNLLCYKCKKS